MKSPHIGIDARLLAYRQGGIAEYIRQLLATIPLLNDETHYTFFHSRRAVLSTDSSANIHRTRLWTPPHHRWERTALSLELARHRLHLYHSPDFIPPRRGARVHVITIHDLHFMRYPQFQTADSLRYYRDQLPWAVKHADHIFAQTEGTKTEIVDMLQVHPQKITVHGLGVHEAFQPLPAEVVQEKLTPYHLPDAYLLFVGTIEPRKNIPNLLASYARLRQKYRDIPPLVLAGQKGWHSEASFAAIEKHQLQDRVIWCDHIPFEVLPALYNRAKALILPSFHEGFGMPAIEAMACGTPVVISERGSLPEVVGDHGVYIQPEDIESIADGIFRILSDHAFTAQLRERGLPHAQGFSWQRMTRIILDVYRQLLS